MAAGGAFAGIAIGNNIRRLKSGIETAMTSWKALEPRGLRLGEEAVTGFEAASGTKRPVLTGNIADCDVAVHIRSDAVHYATTEIAVKPAEGVDATIGVHPSPGGLLGYLKSWIGQDIQVGDERFDDAFLVTAKPESAAKVLLTPALQDRLLGFEGGRFGGLTYSKDRVTVILLGVETDATSLGAAIELACAAASWKL